MNEQLMLRYVPLLQGDGCAWLRSVRGRPRHGHGAPRWSQLTGIGLLLATDLAGVSAAAAIGYLSWGHLVLHQRPHIYVELAPLLGLFPASYAAAGLYPGFGLGAAETLRRLVHATNIAFVCLAAASFAFKADPAYSRMTFCLTWAAALLLVPLFRFIVLSLAGELRWWGEATIIVGPLDQAADLIGSLKRAFLLGYQVVGVLNPTPSERSHVGEVPVLGGLEQASALKMRGVRTALVWDSPQAAGSLPLLCRQFRRVVLIRDAGLMPLENVKMRNLGGVMAIDFSGAMVSRRNYLLKRSLDILVAAPLLVCTAPLIGLCGLLVKLLSPGPMFFRQPRAGTHGRTFEVWKLRTMYPDAEKRLASCLAANPELERQWRTRVKLDPDPRLIPCLGYWLRRFSLDELPQLWNVLNGTMSLVGPRPFPDYHLARFSEPFQLLRGSMRPGLTGLWQVTIRSASDLARQELYDSYYIYNWSLWLDGYILLQTVFAALAGQGAA